MTDLTPKPPTQWRSILHCCRPLALKITEDATSRIDEVTSRNHGLSAEVERAHAAAGEMQGKLRSKNESLEADLLESKKDVASKGSEIEGLRSRNEDLSAEVERARERCAALAAELRDAKRAAGEAQGRLRSKNESLEADLLQSEKEVASKGSEVKGLRADLRTKQRRLDQTAEAMENMSKDLENAVTERDTFVKSLNKKLDGLRSSLVGLTTVRDKLTAENGTLKQQISTLQSNVSQISAAKKAETRELRQRLGSVQKRLDDAEADAKVRAGDLEAYKGRAETADRRVEELSLELSVAREERDELDKDLKKRIEREKEARDAAWERQKEELMGIWSSLADDSGKEELFAILKERAGVLADKDAMQQGSRPLDPEIVAAANAADNDKENESPVAANAAYNEKENKSPVAGLKSAAAVRSSWAGVVKQGVVKPNGAFYRGVLKQGPGL